MYGRNQHSVVKQLSSNQKKEEEKEEREKRKECKFQIKKKGSHTTYPKVQKTLQIWNKSIYKMKNKHAPGGGVQLTDTGWTIPPFPGDNTVFLQGLVAPLIH